MTLVKRIDAEWWEGRVNGRTGLVPGNYIEVIEEPVTRDSQDTLQESVGPHLWFGYVRNNAIYFLSLIPHLIHSFIPLSPSLSLPPSSPPSFSFLPPSSPPPSLPSCTHRTSGLRTQTRRRGSSPTTSEGHPGPWRWTLACWRSPRCCQCSGPYSGCLDPHLVQLLCCLLPSLPLLPSPPFSLSLSLLLLPPLPPQEALTSKGHCSELQGLVW